MVPAPTNAAAGAPSCKVKYSKLPSTDDGHISRQEEPLPAEDCCKPTRCPGVARSHLLACQESPTEIPYKAIACATLQFSIGAFLVVTGCLLLAGYISKVGPSRAAVILIVGILVWLPGFYHLLVAWRAHRGCEGYSCEDLPDCDD